MVDLLADNPLFLLFLVLAVGYPLGRLRVGGARFGIATILFAGLAIGGIDDDLRLPEFIYQLGLVVFVYTIGLSSGRGFVRSIRQRGATIVGWAIGMVGLGAGVAALAWWALSLPATESAGLFAGGTTNTPALAGLLDYLAERAASDDVDTLLAEPVVAYSIAYPMGVLGTMAAIAFFHRQWHVSYPDEARRARTLGFENTGDRIETRTLSDCTQVQLRPHRQRVAPGPSLAGDLRAPVTQWSPATRRE
jgi:putative transport protein